MESVLARHTPKKPSLSVLFKSLYAPLLTALVVKVVVDYQRDIPQGSGETTVKRAFATVNMTGSGAGGKCLQELMVESGMATVARLRQDDPRTEGYDAIVAAESAARNAKKGVHSNGEPWGVFVAACASLRCPGA